MSFFDRFRKQQADPMSSATVPGSPGTRTMNNMPLFIGGAIMVGFVIIVVTVMNQRANQGQGTAQTESARKGNGSANMAAELTAPWAAGQIIPSIGQTAPLNPEAKKEPDTPASPNTQQTDTPPALDVTAALDVAGTALTPINRWALYQERFDSTKVAAFEAAVKNPTAVQISAQASSRPSLTQLNETRILLEQTRQQLASAGDPNAAYQARLAALRGEQVGNSPAPVDGLAMPGKGQANSVDRYTRSHTWELPNQLAMPAPYTVQAGFVLPAIMISGIISDLPGQVMAHVSQNVYDSPSGRHLLIPQGTRLIGTYNSDIIYGQKRVLMAWQRLVFPDGRTLDIQAMPGADSAGKAGFNDQVNTHFWRTISSAFLLSGVVAAVSLTQGDKSESGDSGRKRASDSLSEALGQTLGSAMAEQLRKNINVSPTLEIRPGYRFNVMVSKDIVFDGPYVPIGY